MPTWPNLAWLLVLALPLTALAAEFSSHPRQPEGAQAAMQAIVGPCLERAGRLAFDPTYSAGIQVSVQNLLRIYQTTEAASLGNRQAKSLIFAICRTLEDVVPEPESRSWWDFLKD